MAGPLWHVMHDLIDQKRIQCGSLDPVVAAKHYSVGVTAAARELGITTGAVRHAIAAKRRAARKVRGRWHTTKEAVAGFRVAAGFRNE